jgi:putative transposase
MPRNPHERLMEEIKRRTLVVRIFPNFTACLRLVRALAVETHENWIEAMQYLNMEPCESRKRKRYESWEMRRNVVLQG